MRKFLLPIINLVNVILVSITFGLAKNPVGSIEYTSKLSTDLNNYYNVVWGYQETPNAIGIVGFFLFVVAAFLTLVAFLPVKARKFVTEAAGALYIGAGVLFLLTPSHYCINILGSIELSGSLIAMAVLVFVAGALNLLMSVLEFTTKESK